MLSQQIVSLFTVTLANCRSVRRHVGYLVCSVFEKRYDTIRDAIFLRAIESQHESA